MSNGATESTGPAELIFGHPKGLFVLVLTEAWERMSYYGMRSLLALYMINFLLVKPEVGQEVLGFNFVSGVYQSLFHTQWAPQPLMSWIYGLYTGFVYLTPLFGGMMADRLIGRRKSVILGGLLMAIGQFMLMSPKLFFPGLMLLILGNGCFKPNISTQVGGLYAPGDRRRDSAFSIFYVGINVGAFLAPLICGTLGQTVGWHWGFGSAGVGMLLGLVFYVLNQKALPVEPMPTTSATAPIAGFVGYLVGVPVGILALMFLLTLPTWIPLTLAVAAVVSAILWIVKLPAEDKPRVVAIVVACVIVAAFWAVYEQQGNTMQVWADQNTHWPTVLGFTIPSTWYQAFNPFMIVFFTPALTWLWAQQARKNQEPTSLTKMAMGSVMLGLGFIVMIVASTGMAPDAQRSPVWLFGATAIFTLGELYLSPIGLSFVTKVAPARIVSMMMGVWFLANFIGNYMTGYLGTFYEKMPKQQFFILLTALAIVVAWGTRWLSKAVLEPRTDAIVQGATQADARVAAEPMPELPTTPGTLARALRQVLLVPTNPRDAALIRSSAVTHATNGELLIGPLNAARGTYRSIILVSATVVLLHSIENMQDIYARMQHDLEALHTSLTMPADSQQLLEQLSRERSTPLHVAERSVTRVIAKFRSARIANARELESLASRPIATVRTVARDSGGVFIDVIVPSDEEFQSILSDVGLHEMRVRVLSVELRPGVENTGYVYRGEATDDFGLHPLGERRVEATQRRRFRVRSADSLGWQGVWTGDRERVVESLWLAIASKPARAARDTLNQLAGGTPRTVDVLRVPVLLADLSRVAAVMILLLLLLLWLHLDRVETLVRAGVTTGPYAWVYLYRHRAAKVMSGLGMWGLPLLALVVCGVDLWNSYALVAWRSLGVVGGVLLYGWVLLSLVTQRLRFEELLRNESAFDLADEA